MTDDARRIIGAFSDAPVMTLQVVSTMAGLWNTPPVLFWSSYGRPGWCRRGMNAGVWPGIIFQMIRKVSGDIVRKGGVNDR